MIVLTGTDAVTLTNSAGTLSVLAAWADRDGVTFTEGASRLNITSSGTAVATSATGVRMVRSLHLRASLATTVVISVGGQTWRTIVIPASQTVDALANALAQPSTVSLQALAALTPATDRLAYFTDANTAALATFTTFARTLLDDTDAAAARTTLSAETAGAAAAAQAFAIQRGNHTGTQLAATISDFAAAALLATAAAYESAGAVTAHVAAGDPHAQYRLEADPVPQADVTDLVTDLAAKLHWVAAPASATATGTAGQVAYDASYLYLCTATDTWRRIAHATW